MLALRWLMEYKAVVGFGALPNERKFVPNVEVH